MKITSNTSRSSSVESRSGSSSNSSSSSEDNDDLLFDTTYVPPNGSSENDNDGETNCNANNADIETPSTTSMSIYPSFGSTPNTSSFPNTPSLMILMKPLKKGVKCKRNENTWKRNLNKKFRNNGKAYEMHTAGNKVREERKMRPPCTEKCKMKYSISSLKRNRCRLLLHIGTWVI